MRLRPLKDKVLVTTMERGERRLGSGIILPNDDGRDGGIRPRWARVYAVGSDAPEDIQEGDWALIDHGMWSRGLKLRDENGEEFTVYQVDWRRGILGTQQEDPEVQFG